MSIQLSSVTVLIRDKSHTLVFKAIYEIADNHAPCELMELGWISGHIDETLDRVGLTPVAVTTFPSPQGEEK